MNAAMRVLAFDVNETLLDLGVLDGLFEEALGDAALRQQWFAQMLQLAFVGAITDRYVDSVPAAAAYERAARGLVEQLDDPYSELLAPRAREEFARGTNGRYGGIGMLLEEIHGTGKARRRRSLVHVLQRDGRRPDGRRGQDVVGVKGRGELGFDAPHLGQGMHKAPCGRTLRMSALSSGASSLRA